MNTISQINSVPQHSEPLRLFIDFRFQAYQTPDGYTATGEGLAQFTLLVGSTTYGPYMTSLRTTHAAWMMRKALIPTRDAQLLDTQVSQLNKNLRDAWNTFPNKKSEITGEMILNRAGLRVFKVAEGGALYVI